MKTRVKIYCRSFDLRLYELSKHLCEVFGWECVRLTDQTADGYFYTMLQDTDCDIAVNVDEDCFITHPDAVSSLVDYVQREEYANAGCADGGVADFRTGNPLVTNPFFNVLNLRLIRTRYSKEAVRTFNYAMHKERLTATYPLAVQAECANFDNTDKEPYYGFFLWLAANFKVLYLPHETHADGRTTILYNQAGEPMCLHTWFARFYSMPTFLVKHFQKNGYKQQKRIDAVIDEAYELRGIPRPKFSRTDKIRFFFDRLLRWLIKIPQRIAGWPRKWRKRLKNKTNK